MTPLRQPKLGLAARLPLIRLLAIYFEPQFCFSAGQIKHNFLAAGFCLAPLPGESVGPSVGRSGGRLAL